jgi:glycosyltransferase involved in cell wall biosynthesis
MSEKLTMKYLLLQPWFSAPGHPAQSLIRTYRAIYDYIQPEVIVYKSHTDHHTQILEEYIYESNASTITDWRLQKVFKDLLAAGTVALVIYISKHYNNPQNLSIFFLDSNLYILSFILSLYPIKPQRLNVLCMVAPDFYQRNKFSSLTKWFLVKKLFSLPFFYLYLRTPELAKAWQEELPEYADKIQYLPSLELYGSKFHHTSKISNACQIKKFVVAGQIRPQKSVDILFTLFDNCQLNIGYLKIAGKIVDSALSHKLSQKKSCNVTIIDQFLSEDQMKDILSDCHYNLMLYTDDWDNRMESSMLFESMKYGCPIIAFEGGWLGNTVQKEKIGWTIRREQIGELSNILANLPHPATDEYQAILDNLNRSHNIWSSAEMVHIFLNKLGWDKI